MFCSSGDGAAEGAVRHATCARWVRLQSTPPSAEPRSRRHFHVSQCPSSSSSPAARRSPWLSPSPRATTPSRSPRRRSACRRRRRSTLGYVRCSRACATRGSCERACRRGYVRARGGWRPSEPRRPRLTVPDLLPVGVRAAARGNDRRGLRRLPRRRRRPARDAHHAVAAARDLGAAARPGGPRPRRQVHLGT